MTHPTYWFKMAARAWIILAAAFSAGLQMAATQSGKGSEWVHALDVDRVCGVAAQVQLFFVCSPCIPIHTVPLHPCRQTIGSYSDHAENCYATMTASKGNYTLSLSVQEDTISFNVSAPTTGWVGIGFSLDQNMVSSMKGACTWIGLCLIECVTALTSLLYRLIQTLSLELMIPALEG